MSQLRLPHINVLNSDGTVRPGDLRRNWLEIENFFNAGGHTHNDPVGGPTSHVLGGVAEAGATVPTATATQSIAEGDFASASGVGAIAIGASPSSASASAAVSDGAIAIGGSVDSTLPGAQASGTGAIAIGASTTNPVAQGARGLSSGIAIGPGALAQGGIVIGRFANNGLGAIAIGTNALIDLLVPGGREICIGTGSHARGDGSIVIGAAAETGSNTAPAPNAIAIGPQAKAVFTSSVAIGNGVIAHAANETNLGANRLFSGCPNSAPASGDLDASQVSFWVNEAGNAFTIVVKYAGGTVKTGTVALA